VYLHGVERTNAETPERNGLLLHLPCIQGTLLYSRWVRFILEGTLVDVWKLSLFKLVRIQAGGAQGERELHASFCSPSCFSAVFWTPEICVFDFIKVVCHLVSIQAGGAQGGGQDLEQALQAKLLAKQRQVRRFLDGQSDGGSQFSADGCRRGSDHVPFSSPQIALRFWAKPSFEELVCLCKFFVCFLQGPSVSGL
jgi:hypothetical protein